MISISKQRLALSAVFSFLALAACNTVKGAGQDVQVGGAAVESAAKDVQTGMQTEAPKKDPATN